MPEIDKTISAPVFNIQSYSIHDGPGIRVTVFLKGCPLRCLWCANPESNLAKPQLMTYASRCTGCGACTAACPKKAIRLEEKDGKHIAVTDRSLCETCGDCVAVCPSEARELAGKQMTVEEVLAQVQKDRLFLDASGGGMTISGGECLMHPDFTEALLRAAKEVGLHTAVESCCFASRAVIDRIFPLVDYAMLDLKHMDSALHKQYTGVPNELILDNLRHICRDLHVKTMISLPIIPGYNDDEAEIAAAAKFIAEELGTDVSVRLLPYHRLGESKNESLGQTLDFSIPVPTDEFMQTRKALVESFGLTAQIGG